MMHKLRFINYGSFIVNNMENPFVTYHYAGPAYFCDRETELSKLLEAFDNHRYVLLYSMRRLGKSGLIHHLHQVLNKRRNVMTIYCDVQNTRSDQEFMTKLISAAIAAVEKSKKGVIARIGKYFGALRPVLTFDPATNLPTIEVQVHDRQQVQSSLDILMEMLGGLDQSVQIAVDEFQQISNYEVPSNIDATLRGYLHKIPNTHFIFSGSQRHLLLELFSDAKKPFFSATDHMHLHPLDPQIYADFILKKFRGSKQKISMEVVEHIIDWTRIHTYHTQYFCNRLFAKRHQEIGPKQVEEIKSEVLYTFEQSFLQLQSTLSRNQWKCLRGIAHENSVESVSNKEFLQKYNLAQSSAHQAVHVLLDHELIYEERKDDKLRWFVYDPFFSRWLENR
ncbi:MAG: ATP-binding protein [Saprospiraceae bacterium]|nr:ATP-binding protein [Saprospiraceae bacterium]